MKPSRASECTRQSLLNYLKAHYDPGVENIGDLLLSSAMIIINGNSSWDLIMCPYAFVPLHSFEFSQLRLFHYIQYSILS
jgi:hypothetical protein